MKGICFAKHRSWYTANSKRQRIATVSRYSWALEKENIWSWNRPSVSCEVLIVKTEAAVMSVVCFTESLKPPGRLTVWRWAALQHLRTPVYTLISNCESSPPFVIVKLLCCLVCKKEHERLEILTVNLRACVHSQICQRHFSQHIKIVFIFSVWMHDSWLWMLQQKGAPQPLC